MARCLDPKGRDGKLLAKKIKEHIAESQSRKQKEGRKRSKICGKEKEGSDGEGVVEPQATASYEEEVAAAARAVAAGSQEPVGDFQCSVCRELYTRMDSLQKHFKKHHTPVEGGVPCPKDYCQEVFETRHEMLNHRDGDKVSEPCTYKCSLCPFETQRNGRFRGHEKMHSSNQLLQDWEGFKK